MAEDTLAQASVKCNRMFYNVGRRYFSTPGNGCSVCCTCHYTKSMYHPAFGFREGRSTDDAIHQSVEKIQDSKNKKLHTSVISLNIQVAFDQLQYSSIRNSLDEINFPSHTIETHKDYLLIGSLPSKQPKAQ
ncbi:hypothetical protein AVEN_26493-1 [Araneus ventricosus]|uniref:Uncharacterized protein n=1 Tax=Araneus ventricosus TaxID=182803 RepID=A0A4Y2CVX4_ARAVE|nr:hypothetical protein AVEN_26493-1 [Araneus ventricosus]